MRAADRANLLQRLAVLLEQNDVLVTARAERLHEPAALNELLNERCRHARVRGCDNDRVEGRVVRQSLAPVSDEDDDVCALGERGAGRFREFGEALDAEHFARKPRKQGCLPSVTGADLEHTLVAR